VFDNHAAATGNARSPRLDRLVAGTNIECCRSTLTWGQVLNHGLGHGRDLSLGLRVLGRCLGGCGLKSNSAVVQNCVYVTQNCPSPVTGNFM